MRSALSALVLSLPLFAQVSFAPAVQYPSGAGNFSVIARDFNSDGLPDVVVDNDYTISFLPNLGGGQLGARTVFITGSSVVDPLDAADLNGDGALDVVVGSTPPAQEVAVLFGVGDGTFAPPVGYPVSHYVNDIDLADLDGDGDIDVAASAHSGSRVYILKNDGQGNLSFEPVVWTPNPVLIALSDVDADGDIDLVASQRENDPNAAIRVHLNTGSAAFVAGAVASVTTLTGLNGPEGVDCTDVDGDGDLDVVVCMYNSNGVGTAGVLHNDGSGNFGSVSEQSIGGQNHGLQGSDLNGDGFPELVLADFGLDRIHVLENDGAGGFPTQSVFPVGQKPQTLGDFADMDGDGRCDFVIANVDSLDVSVLLNTSSVPPPAFPYPGTMEDLQLLTGIAGATPTTGPSSFIKTASTNDSITVVLESPGGGFSGAVFGIGVQLFPTGNPPIVSAPGIQIPSPITLIYSGAGPVVFGLPATGITLPLTVPPGLVGMSGLFQGAVFTPNAANGVFATTHGHEIQVTQ